jgi:hypothetical protein
MAITHDGITCRLPPSLPRVAVGFAALGCAGWLVSTGQYLPGGGLGFFALLYLLNQIGSRRIRVIDSKLLVEDEHLLLNLLIGPSRRRINWTEVKSVHVDSGRLRLETSGSPFITAQGASAEDLESLRARIEATRARAARSSS